MLSNPDQLVREVMAEGLRVRRPMSLMEWSEAYRELTDRFSARPGRWRTDVVPAAAGVMDTLSDPQVRRVLLCKPTQVWGTEVFLNWIAWLIDQRPGPMMIVYPTVERAQEINSRRLQPALRRIPRLTRYFTGNRHDEKRLELSLGNMHIRFAGAKNQANLESIPCRNVGLDELDRAVEVQPEVLEIASKRIGSFDDGKVFALGTPGMEDEGIDLAIKQGQELRFHVPCPQCGQYHTRTFADIRWAHAEGQRAADVEPDAAALSAYMVCPANGCEIMAAHNLWQQRRGVWIAAEERVVSEWMPTADDLLEDSEWYRMTWREWRDDPPAGIRIENPQVRASSVGFRLHGAYRTMAADGCYGTLARAWCAAKGHANADIVQNGWGEPWGEKGDRIEEHPLRSLCATVAKGGYEVGTVPRDAWLLVGAIDVQKNGVYVTVRAFETGCMASALVWFEFVHRSEGARLEDESIRRIIDYRFRVFGEEQTRRVAVWAVDSGHWTEDVYRYCLRSLARGAVMVPAKGVSGATKPTRMMGIEDSNVAGLQHAGLKVLAYQPDHFKTQLHAQVLGSIAGDGAWRLPEDTPQAYLEQVTAEERKRTRRKGVWRDSWELRKGRRDNHALDCEVMTLAVVSEFVMREWRPERPAAPRQDRPSTRSKWMEA